MTLNGGGNGSRGRESDGGSEASRTDQRHCDYCCDFPRVTSLVPTPTWAVTNLATKLMLSNQGHSNSHVGLIQSDNLLRKYYTKGKFIYSRATRPKDHSTHLYFTHLRPVHSNTNLTSQGCIQPCCNYCMKIICSNKHHCQVLTYNVNSGNMA